MSKDQFGRSRSLAPLLFALHPIHTDAVSFKWAVGNFVEAKLFVFLLTGVWDRWLRRRPGLRPGAGVLPSLFEVRIT